MSGILARLRHAFQDELLVRVGRNLELTALAAELAAPVHDAVRQVEDLLNLRQPFAPEASAGRFVSPRATTLCFSCSGRC